jgi:hypothetical protein
MRIYLAAKLHSFANALKKTRSTFSRTALHPLSRHSKRQACA